MSFFVFRLPACVRYKIRLQPSDEEAVPRGGRVILETDMEKMTELAKRRAGEAIKIFEETEAEGFFKQAKEALESVKG